MSIEELRAAFLNDEELEYHLMGMEEGAHLLRGPGWYTCVVEEIYNNGDIEIQFTDPDLLPLWCTVLAKNIPIAFRAKSEVQYG